MTNLASKRKKLKFRQTVRNKSFYFGVVVSFLVITTPLLFYVYRYCPSDVETWETKWFTINSGGFASAQGFVYSLASKLLLVATTSIWYLTSKNWWRHTILVPLSIYLFQLSGVLNTQQQIIDEYDFIKALPIIIPVLIIHVIAARKINHLSFTLDFHEELEQEIDSMIKSNNE